jgi:hypothetical protein
MSRLTTVVAAVALSSSAVACQRGGSNELIPAGFWFESLTPASVAVVSGRLSAPLTADDLLFIESAARRELLIAFEHTRLHFTATHPVVYRVRVVPQIAHSRPYAAAGQSRSFGGIRGDGAVNFNTVALSALAFASAGSDRDTLLAAIGRGVGRTAVHEFAHQILGPATMDGTDDRFSYEHADLRAEHFYAPLHWGPAAALLRQRVGLNRAAGE